MVAKKTNSGDGKRIGYVRVSSVDQNDARQLDGVEQRDTANAVLRAHDFVYDPAYPWRLYSEAFGGYFASRIVTRLYETSTTGSTVAGRGRGFKLGTAVGSSSDLEQTYAFAGSGRLDTLTTQRTGNTASRIFHYGYSPTPRS